MSKMSVKEFMKFLIFQGLEFVLVACDNIVININIIENYIQPLRKIKEQLEYVEKMNKIVFYIY